MTGKTNSSKRVERNIVRFELRAGKDDDIVKALDELITIERTKSSIVRDALRYYLQKKDDT